jgi:hypothetical protein
MCFHYLKGLGQFFIVVSVLVNSGSVLLEFDILELMSRKKVGILPWAFLLSVTQV